MAKGYPDFFGEQVFLQKGNIMREEHSNKNQATGTIVYPISLSGKGEIIGGFLYIYSITDFTKVLIDVTVPGYIAKTVALSELFARHTWLDRSNPLYMTVYDTVALECYFTWTAGMTYRENVVLAIQNTTGANISSSGIIYYYDVV